MITVRKLTPIGCFLIRHHLADLELIAKISKVFKDDKLDFYIIKFNCIDLQIILDASRCDADHPDFKDLVSIQGLWKQFSLDESRTCVYWNDRIDLPSDSIYEYGKII